jgi:GH18 family chitinase
MVILANKKKDFHGSADRTVNENAPLYTRPSDTDKTLNVDYAVTYWLNKGFPAQKINLGMSGNVGNEIQLRC